MRLPGDTARWPTQSTVASSSAIGDTEAVARAIAACTRRSSGLRSGGGAKGVAGLRQMRGVRSGAPGAEAADAVPVGALRVRPGRGFAASGRGALGFRFDSGVLIGFSMFRAGRTQFCIVPIVWRRRWWASVRNSAPIAVTIANAGHTTSSPAPRNRMDCASDT